MRSLVTIIFYTCIALEFCSCGPGIELAEFSFNDRQYNSLIVDRVPKYGLDKPDGCIVEGQVSLALKSVGERQIQGVIMDVDTEEPLSSAYVWLFAEDTTCFVSDTNGKFQIPNKSSYSRMEVLYVGYRSLIVDLSKKDLIQ